MIVIPAEADPAVVLAAELTEADVEAIAERDDVARRCRASRSSESGCRWRGDERSCGVLDAV